MGWGVRWFHKNILNVFQPNITREIANTLITEQQQHRTTNNKMVSARKKNTRKNDLCKGKTPAAGDVQTPGGEVVSGLLIAVSTKARLRLERPQAHFTSGPSQIDRV